ncbi:hypothetical protein, partial [Arthrobacter sp. KK5.5]|uniref:hypothetical protein n=1 Tax=Arthrobacter sp. KK5.5 TaxID=3373084 RepID=UPI003EE54EF9
MKRLQFTTVTGELYLVDLASRRMVSLPGDDPLRAIAGRHPTRISRVEPLQVGQPAVIHYALPRDEIPPKVTKPVAEIEEDPAVWAWDDIVDPGAGRAHGTAAADAYRRRVRDLAGRAATRMSGGVPTPLDVRHGGDTITIAFRASISACEEHFEPLIATGRLGWHRRRTNDEGLIAYTFLDSEPTPPPRGLSGPGEHRKRITTASGTVYLLDTRLMGLMRLPGADANADPEDFLVRPVLSVEQLEVGQNALFVLNTPRPTNPDRIQSTTVVSIEEDPEQWEWDGIVTRHRATEIAGALYWAVRSAAEHAARETGATVEIDDAGRDLHLAFTADDTGPGKLADVQDAFEAWATAATPWSKQRLAPGRVRYTIPDLGQHGEE